MLNSLSIKIVIRYVHLTKVEIHKYLFKSNKLIEKTGTDVPSFFSLRKNFKNSFRYLIQSKFEGFC